MTFDINFVLTK